MIKAICFDLDGVYFTSQGKQGFINRLNQLTNNPAKVKFAFTESTEYAALCKGELSVELFINWLNKYLATDFDQQSLAQFWIKDYQINPQVQNYINSIREQGILSCTISNNNQIRVDALQNKFNFLADFDIAIFSYQEKCFKPDPQIFQKLIQRSGLKSDEIFYTDDSSERISGASSLGIKTLIYQDWESFITQLAQLI